MDAFNPLEQFAPETVAGLLAPYPVLFAYLYGSYVTGTTRPDSDLDIGIYLDPVALSRSLDVELTLALDIDRLLAPPLQADVRAINRMPLTLLGPLVNQGRLIYSRNEIARVDFEVYVRMAYFDFLPALQHYREAYLSSAGIG